VRSGLEGEGNVLYDKGTTFNASSLHATFLLVLMPLRASIDYVSSPNILALGFAAWDETSLLMNTKARETSSSSSW